MDMFEKVFRWTMAAFGAIIGFLCALVVIRVALSVLGVMLGSTVGCLIIAVVAIHYFKKYREGNL